MGLIPPNKSKFTSVNALLKGSKGLFNHNLTTYGCSQSFGLFEGNVSIKPSAKYTVANQFSANFFLSENCLLRSNPFISIEVPEVKASHGSKTRRIYDSSFVFFFH